MASKSAYFSQSVSLLIRSMTRRTAFRSVSTSDFDPRALDFHRHGLSTGKTSAMNLAQGGGGQRSLIQTIVDLLQRPAELRLGLLPEFCKIYRLHLVLQAGQLLGHRLGEDVHPGAEELAQLDHQPSQVHRGVPEAPGLGDEQLLLALFVPGLGCQSFLSLRE